MNNVNELLFKWISDRVGPTQAQNIQQSIIKIRSLENTKVFVESNKDTLLAPHKTIDEVLAIVKDIIFYNSRLHCLEVCIDRELEAFEEILKGPNLPNGEEA